MAGETFRIEIPIDVKDNTDPGVSRATSKMNAFDRQNQKTQERLDKMNREKYQVVLGALDRASSVIGKVASGARSLAGKTFSFTMSVLDKATAPLRGILNFVTSIQGAILGTTGAFAGIVKPMDIAADFEQTKIAFTTMLKSAEKAEEFLKNASDYANKTPFEFPELINSSKLLLAFGFEANKIFDLMTIIGDTSSGLGAGAEGIDRITRALGQMQAKGRPQAEELLQLQELGVPANQILQEELGLTGEQVAEIGKQGLEASKVIDALLRGMSKRFGGMMDNQSKSAKGMISTISDTLHNGLLRPWGEGLWEGIKPGFEKVTSWLDANGDKVTEWGQQWKEAGANISKWVMSKVEALQQNIQKMVNSPEWENAQTFGEKAKIAWNKVIAEPFSEWWNSTGKEFFVEKAASIGQGIGSGITAGLLVILGINPTDATGDGASVGASFLQGFMDGFDTGRITEALKEWASNNAVIVAGLGAFLGYKIIGGISKAINIYNDMKNILGKGDNGMSKLPGNTTPVMSVTATVVNIYGKSVNDIGSKLPTGRSGPPNAPAPFPGPTTSGPIAIPGPAKGGPPALPAPTRGGPLALPGPVTSGPIVRPTPTSGGPLALPGRMGAAGGATTYGGRAAWLAQAPGGAVGARLAGLGVTLGSGAKTAAGAAAAGAASIAGIVAGAAGIISGLKDFFKAGKETDAKKKQDLQFSGGTKMGMVGAGAGIGAAVGSIVPVLGTGVGAAVGAGVGGITALLGGDEAGKALSDSIDDGGALATFWENAKTWADNTWDAVKQGAADAGDWIGGKFSQASDWISGHWSGFSGWFSSNVWMPVKDIGISAINIAAGAWGEAKGFIADKWHDLAAWFDNTIWEPIKEAARTASEWIGKCWDEAKAWITDRWMDFSTWFDDTIWTPIKEATTSAGEWIFQKWGDAKTWIIDLWSDFSTWFDNTIWMPIKEGAAVAGQWISDKWDAAKTWIADTWGSVSAWFDESVWGPVKDAAHTAGEWIGNKLIDAKSTVISAWEGVSGWFNNSVWGPIKSAAADAADWVKNKWEGAKSWVADIGKKGSQATGLSTSESKGSVLEHAHGGIMTKPHMGIVAEAGPESIIPLSPSKRDRGIDLWEQTGRNLGVMPYEDGGIVGDSESESEDTIPVVAAAGGTGTVNMFDIKVEAKPEFVIQGQGEDIDEEKIVAILKAYIREMADDIGDELADRLARIFANMPVKGGV